MKIAFLSSIYPKHAQLIYRENPTLRNKSSEEQMEFIRWHALSSYVNWIGYLKDKNCKVLQFHYNLGYLEAQWAKENNLFYSGKNRILKIGLEKLKKFQPDLIYCSSPDYYVSCGFLNELLDSLSRKPKLIAWYGANCGDEEGFRFFDLTLSNSKHLINSLRKIKINSEYLQHSFDPIILDRIKSKSNKVNRIGFFGNLDTSHDFNNRTKLLQKLSSTTKLLDVHGTIEKPIFSARTKHFYIKSRHKLSKLVERVLPTSKIRYWSDKGNLPPSPWQVEKKFFNSIKKPLYGQEMLEKLSHYQIAFNFHNKHTGNNACNMRLFEATGVGCCLLTDHKSDIRSLFEPDAEVVTFNNYDDAITKAKYLVENPLIAKQIALAGQKRTLSEYSSKKQVDQLFSYFNNLNI